MWCRRSCQDSRQVTKNSEDIENDIFQKGFFRPFYLFMRIPYRACRGTFLSKDVQWYPFETIGFGVKFGVSLVDG